MFLAKITHRKPSLSREFLVGYFRDNGDRAPLFDSFFDISTLLKTDGGGNRLVNRGCRGVTLNVLRRHSSLRRIHIGCFCRYPLHMPHMFVGLIASGLDLVDEVPCVFDIFSGRLHVSSCFGLELAESPEAEIPSDGGDDAEQCQDDTN